MNMPFRVQGLTKARLVLSDDAQRLLSVLAARNPLAAIPGYNLRCTMYYRIWYIGR